MTTKKTTTPKVQRKKTAAAPATPPSPAPAATRPAQPPPAAAPSAPLTPSAPVTTKVSKEERHRMIAEAAYYISLRRGPSSDPMKNWLEAEAQIDAQLKRDGRL